MANNELILTEEGAQKYREELDNLINVVRRQITQEIKEAKEQGDLSENADYKSARDRQSEVESRILYLQDLLRHAKIIHQDDTSTVNIGVKVTIKYLDDDFSEDYIIVGPAEADPANGKISNECLLGQALIGHKIGDIVTVKVNVPYEVEIVSISKK